MTTNMKEETKAEESQSIGREERRKDVRAEEGASDDRHEPGKKPTAEKNIKERDEKIERIHTWKGDGKRDGKNGDSRRERPMEGVE